MRPINLSAANWRKSSYSNQDGGACVEICEDFPGLFPVRDSKSSDGPTLTFPAGSWLDFVSAVKSGKLAA